MTAVGDRIPGYWTSVPPTGMFEQRIDFRHTKDCEAVWENRSTFIWKQSEPQSVIKREADFWSLNLTNVCH